MPDLQFHVASIHAVADACALRFQLDISNAPADEEVTSIALSTQLQIEPARRRYSEVEKKALNDLFGEPSRWPTTVRPLFWTTVHANIPGFRARTLFDLLVPCDIDSDLAAARYLRALNSGDIPVALLFSGRVLYVSGDSVQMCPIPWSQETTARVPYDAYRCLIAANAGTNSPGALWT